MAIDLSGYHFSGIVMMMVLPKWLSPTPPKMKTTVLTVEDPRTEYEINLAASKEMELLTTALKGYFSAKTIEEMCQYVRLPERVRPMMATYYAKKPLVPNPIAGKLPALEPLPSPEGRNFWVAKCALKDGQIKNIVVETRSNGEVKVDWENATGYQIMGFDEFADQQPRELPLDFRVNIKYGSYYADEFSDEEIWRCFMLSAPNATSIIYGYIKRDNPLLGELEDLIRRNGGTSRLGILQLKFPREFQAKRAALIEKSSAPSGSI
ncbi:MAG: hypothetical protein HC767_05820 [Akkermansiaceae bacterium]|nr:hypothetical protein [Akkermansiaceae bacterium]